MLTYTDAELKQMFQYPITPWDLEKLVETARRLMEERDAEVLNAEEAAEFASNDIERAETRADDAERELEKLRKERDGSNRPPIPAGAFAGIEAVRQ